MKKTAMSLGIIVMLVGQACNDDEVSTPTVTGLDCTKATFSTAAVSGTAYTATVTVPYTGGNGIVYPAGSGIASSGVTGLTATMASGTLANGTGTVMYNITGTPGTSGTATFPILVGGQTCNLSLPVGTASPTVTGLTCANTTYSVAATSGAVYTGTATVPYTGGNSMAYLAGSGIASTGVTGMTATLQSGTLTNGAGNLTYNITGTPGAVGTATFPLTFGGQTCSMTMTVK